MKTIIINKDKLIQSFGYTAIFEYASDILDYVKYLMDGIDFLEEDDASDMIEQQIRQVFEEENEQWDLLTWYFAPSDPNISLETAFEWLEQDLSLCCKIIDKEEN